jgi:isoleucyl-tRNA synthetase
VDTDVVERWNRLLDVRDLVLAQIEPLRKEKKIGSSLQAKVALSAAGEDLAFLQRHARDLAMLFIVSEVEIRSKPVAGSQTALGVEIEPAAGVKCARCWRYVPALSSEPDGAGICPRCQGALAEAVGRP